MSLRLAIAPDPTVRTDCSVPQRSHSLDAKTQLVIRTPMPRESIKTPSSTALVGSARPRRRRLSFFGEQFCSHLIDWLGLLKMLFRLNFACWIANLIFHLVSHKLMPWQNDRLSGALSSYASHRRGGASNEGEALEKVYASDLYPSRWYSDLGRQAVSSKEVMGESSPSTSAAHEGDIGDERVNGYDVPMPYVPMAQYRRPPFSDIDETTEPPSRPSTAGIGYRAISTSIPKVKETFGKMLPLWNKSRQVSMAAGGGAPGISRTMLLAARDDPIEDPCECSR